MSDSASRLLAHLSHELRGPLGVLRGYLRLLDQGRATLDARQQKAVAAALAASDRAVTLVNEASELGRLLNGEVTLTRVTLPFASLLHAAIQAVELPGEPAIDLDVSAGSSVVSVDETRMRDALVALVTSVVRAQARPGTVQLTASPLRIRSKPAVRLVVAPHTVSHLRTRELPFDAARGGQGLQAAIAVAVVEAHGGVVRERHQGSRPAGVIVRLPAVR